jgi:hypothetical protein
VSDRVRRGGTDHVRKKTAPPRQAAAPAEPIKAGEAEKPAPPTPEEAKDEAAAQPAPAEGEKVALVDCGGVNACKGQGTCKTEKHGCSGQNECKGQGVLEMSEAECVEKGGTVAARK